MVIKMNIYWNTELYHYGMPRRSGRYKWGSGEDPYHHGASSPRGYKLQKKRDRLAVKRAANNADIRNVKKRGGDLDRVQKKKDRYDKKIAKIDEQLKQEKKQFEAYKKAMEEQSNQPDTMDDDTKQELIRSANPNAVLQYNKMLNASEFKEAMKRIEYTRKLDDITRQEQENGKRDFTNKILKVIDSGVKIYEKYGKYFPENQNSNQNNQNNNKKQKQNQNQNPNQNQNQNPNQKPNDNRNGSKRMIFSGRPQRLNKQDEPTGRGTFISDTRPNRLVRRAVANTGYSVASNMVPKLNRIPSNLRPMASNTTPYQGRGYRVIPTSGPSSYEGPVRKKYRTPIKWRKR